jgi:GAF domain-containing protein
LVHDGEGSLSNGPVSAVAQSNEIVGVISIGREQVQPFTDKQISLFRDFAAQATIALEITRRERAVATSDVELNRQCHPVNEWR